MTSRQSLSAERLEAIRRYEALRRILCSEQYADHLHKPLAYWALPSDRRLPLAFLGRTLRELLAKSFDQLANTPGVGRKKLGSFIMLLARAAETDPAELPSDLSAGAESQTPASSNGRNTGENGFDPAGVSEVTWAQWRASVVRHGLDREPLGRFAPSLLNMTRVIWNRPLSAYTGKTLAKIRAMKTHGEKRVRAILEVFHALHTMVGGMGTQKHLCLRVVPRHVDRAERWIGRTLQRPGIPHTREIFDCFIQPLLEQIRTDAPEQIIVLAENRLGLRGPITSVRQAARDLGLTRARVYQLLNEINDILVVRWPEGRHLVYELREKLLQEADHMETPPDLEQFHAAVELFYPGHRRGAEGPLEQAPAPVDQRQQNDQLITAGAF